MEMDRAQEQAPLMDRLHKAAHEYNSAMAAANVDVAGTKLAQDFQDVVRVHETMHRIGGKWESCPGPFLWLPPEPPPPAPEAPCKLAHLENEAHLALVGFLHQTTRMGLIAHVSFNTTKGDPT